MRVLLVEDNVALAEELLALLQGRSYIVEWLVDGRDATTRPLHEPFDIIVLDLGLPGRDGLDVLREWRSKGLATPVLVLTARGSWAERVDGLKAGADDYLGKPFHPEELLLRLQALLRRSHGFSNAPVLRAGSLQLDEARQCALQDGREITLTAAEFRLLRLMMLHAGKIVTRLQLVDSLYEGDDEKDSNVIEVHINHLRKKIGKHHIETRRGQGYLFNMDATST